MLKPQSRRVVIVAAVAVITTGVLYATIPDAEGVIHACYSRSQGTIRIIDDSVTNCKQGETSLAWNVKGEPGPPGAPGLPGPKGDTGDSQVFTVGVSLRDTEKSLTVPDLGTVVAECHEFPSAGLTGAMPFDVTTIDYDGTPHTTTNSTSWNSGDPYSGTVWFKNAVAQWHLEFLALSFISNDNCRAAIEVVRID
jgi:hypothetical protein